MQFIRMIAKTVTVFHQGAVLIEDNVDDILRDPRCATSISASRRRRDAMLDVAAACTSGYGRIPILNGVELLSVARRRVRRHPRPQRHGQDDAAARR